MVGTSVGYQQFFNHGRSQVIYELGLVAGLDDDEERDAAALGARYRRAVGQHAVVTVDAFLGNDELNDEFIGGRLELQWKF